MLREQYNMKVRIILDEMLFGVKGKNIDVNKVLLDINPKLQEFAHHKIKKRGIGQHISRRCWKDATRLYILKYLAKRNSDKVIEYLWKQIKEPER